MLYGPPPNNRAIYRVFLTKGKALAHLNARIAQQEMHLDVQSARLAVLRAQRAAALDVKLPDLAARVAKQDAEEAALFVPLVEEDARMDVLLAERSAILAWLHDQVAAQDALALRRGRHAKPRARPANIHTGGTVSWTPAKRPYGLLDEIYSEESAHPAVSRGVECMRTLPDLHECAERPELRRQWCSMGSGSPRRSEPAQ